ncbi:DAK2 domain fusion protein YloV [Orenia metallireducens]|uniref:DAK2 domain fusion protein YloV n=1 Tax=Orenia metallireducens TaxID=1413210 RepID=A0A1C0A6U5_9FIRM|nr:DAK2 domain-containing protein [Orenia metallireducens]OCL25973.1 DAK2 domain fusion protein YloV [Orenia metallireducens]
MLPDSLNKDIKQINSAKFKQMLLVATNTLKEVEDEINDLNIFPVPDGDTGTNMYLTLSNAIEEIEFTTEDSVGAVANKLAMGALMGARGNSGVILSQLLRGLADGIGNAKLLTAEVLANGLQKASDKAYQAVMKPVEGTILTVAKDVGKKAKKLASELTVVELLIEVVKEAEKSVANTPNLLHTLKEADVVDAGGKGYQMFLTGLLQGLSSDNSIIIREQVGAKSNTKVDLSQIEEFGYCTEFIVKNARVEANEFKEILSEYGDSIIAVKSGDILKVHVHAGHPGSVLEEGLKYGQLTRIKIENMSEQHEERLRKEIEAEQVDVSEEQKVVGGIGVLAVAAGEGLEVIFKKLGVANVLLGGQSMNPSIQDLLESVEEINTNKVIILPNNKNVISTAEQVKELTDKEIEVIPTRTIPQGVTAMMVFNPEGDLQEVTTEMKKEVDFVKTGEITYAVRDTKINELEINKGDILGLIEGNIEVVSSHYNQAALDLLEDMVEADDSLITIYVGEEVSSEDKKELIHNLEEVYEDFDIEIYDGYQPIYYYIISVE